MRHLTQGKRLPSGLMSDATWCGGVQVTGISTSVAEVDCVGCLVAVVRAGRLASRRILQLAKNAGR